MGGVEQGTLLIADIGGYTKYLTGVELDHANDAVSNLIGVIVDATFGGFQLAKLEGDAVFTCCPDGELDGSGLIGSLDSCYFAFHRHLRTIAAATTCDCGACRLLPDLTLKFVVHHGSYAVTEMAGLRELVGSDVIVVHRLLKNEVKDKTGLTGYALITQVVLDAFSLDPRGLGMHEVIETYDDVGDIPGWALDMEARWAEERARTKMLVGADAPVSVEVVVDAPLRETWTILSNPRLRLEWLPGVTRVDESTPGGVRGVGATTHCLHSGQVLTEEIVDYLPFHYYTSFQKEPQMLMTSEVSEVTESRTRVAMRLAPADPNTDLAAMKDSLATMQEDFERMIRHFAAFVSGRARATARG